MAKVSIAQGDVFGKLTVIKRAENKNGRVMYLCSCSCGSEPRAYASSHLRSGGSRSCGCLHKETMVSKRKDLLGQVFGRLTVIGPADSNKHGDAMWVCQCECGSEPKAYSGRSLRTGSTTSCGCYHRELTSTLTRASSTHQVQKGDRFGLLTVIGDEPVSRIVKGNHRLYWLCQCDCGSEPKYFRKDSFFYKKDEAEVKNCGCLAAKIRAAAHTTHGLSRTRAKKNEYLVGYRTRKNSSQPAWLKEETANVFADLASKAENNKATGLGVFHIDHIVPLNGKAKSTRGVPVVCGLHVSYNLRLVTRNENLVKGCFVWPDMPDYTDDDIAELQTLAEQII